MTTASFNPFRPTRWEHQRDGYQLIWFTRTGDELASEKSIYVRGSRGSGKTTLLKSVCWEDLAKNESLRLQKRLSDFRHIGVYVRFPDHISSAIVSSRWAEIYPNAADPEYEFHKFFTLIVELTCAERVLTAIHELRLLNEIGINTSQEITITQQIVLEFPKILNFGQGEPRTFLDLSRFFRMIVRLMNEASGRGTIKDLSDLLPAREPGEFLTYVASQLSSAFQINSAGPMRRESLRFKFCLDDCEVLSPQQQKSLNSLVRVARQPISWVVSFVGSLYDVTDTYLARQPLTDADRKVISLDARSENDFRELCQAVVSLRLFFSVSEAIRERGAPKAIGDFFPLDIRLGRRNINDLMLAMANRSTSPDVAHLIDVSQKLKQKIVRVNRKLRSRYGQRDEVLPLYETYVLLLWRGRSESFATTFTKSDEERVLSLATEFSDPAFEAWLRRKQRGALLHFASAYGFRKIPYSGSNIVVSLADGGVRDFLEILGEIFENYTRRHKIDPTDLTSLDRFVVSGSQIAQDIQSDGIYSASHSYFNGVSARADRESDVLSRLLEGLGHYTAILQSDPDDPTTLGRAERGIFNIRFPQKIDDKEISSTLAVWNTIKRAEVSGYIRIFEAGGGDRSASIISDGIAGRTVTFRLHRRFAPHFRFSFRGAYEPVVMDWNDLWALCDRESQINARGWALQMARHPSAKEAGQLSLPLAQVDQDD
ncbi:hypothetical protein [Methylobacterium sp. SD21]|uniref:ORC-CDC6 family AAA ATPase n=1 Tax=Methylobacterium litchii TaxID=3138810 RepID=UPI00313CEF54